MSDPDTIYLLCECHTDPGYDGRMWSNEAMGCEDPDECPQGGPTEYRRVYEDEPEAGREHKEDSEPSRDEALALLREAQGYIPRKKAEYGGLHRRIDALLERSIARAEGSDNE